MAFYITSSITGLHYSDFVTSPPENLKQWVPAIEDCEYLPPQQVANINFPSSL